MSKKQSTKKLMKPDRVRAGLECDRCPNPPAPGKRSCPTCLVRHAGRAMQRRKQRGSVGICIACGKATGSNRVHCARCLKRAKACRDAHRKKAKRSGACTWCKNPRLPKRTMCGECTERRKEARREWHRQLRRTVFDHYGNRCVCCGEATEVFLALDHINNNGAAHRKEVGAAGSGFYRWVVLNDFPDDLQLLCYNCNVGRYRNGGVCPHKCDTGTNGVPVCVSSAPAP